MPRHAADPGSADDALRRAELRLAVADSTYDEALDRGAGMPELRLFDGEVRRRTRELDDARRAAAQAHRAGTRPPAVG